MKKKVFVSILLIMVFLLSGCQLSAAETEAMIATKVAEAIEEKVAELEDAVVKVEEVVVPEAVETPTPDPTATPNPVMVSQTYVSYDYSYVIGTPGGCLNAVFISENYPDNTIFSSGDAFIKTWTIKNTGYCTWNTNYKLVLTSGDAMGADLVTSLPESVAPGESITLSANLTAPSADGTYRGEWRVQSDTGVNFARFWVQIVVD